MSKFVKWASAVLATPSAIKTVHQTGEIHNVRRGNSTYNTLDPNNMVGPGPLPSKNTTTYKNNDPIKEFLTSSKGGKRNTKKRKTHTRKTHKRPMHKRKTHKH